MIFHHTDSDNVESHSFAHAEFKTLCGLAIYQEIEKSSTQCYKLPLKTILGKFRRKNHIMKLHDWTGN